MSEANHVITELAKAIQESRPAAFVTVISADGSTPREAGAKMLVFEDSSIRGTVGGGSLEALSIRQALECLGRGQGGKYVFDLKPDGNTGMICMGKVEIFVDVYKDAVKLLIIGAGHVGQKIAEAARLAGYPYSVADDRAEFANPERFPGARRILVETPDKAVTAAGIDADTYVVIVTRGHALDREGLAAALKTPAAYIGMIGSEKKVREVYRLLGEKKLFPARDNRVHAPLGLNLGGKTPGEIAVAVLAEIIKVRYERAPTTCASERYADNAENHLRRAVHGLSERPSRQTVEPEGYLRGNAYPAAFPFQNTPEPDQERLAKVREGEKGRIYARLVSRADKPMRHRQRDIARQDYP